MKKTNRKFKKSCKKFLFSFFCIKFACLFIIGLMIASYTIGFSATVQNLSDLTASDITVGINTLLSKYKKWDINFLNGKGYSEKTSSGELAWKESYFLLDYIQNYWTCRDNYWLDKIIDHFDRMISIMHLNSDGFLVWDDSSYSVGIVEITKDDSNSEAKISPKYQRISARAGGYEISGDKYEIFFPSKNQYSLQNVSKNKVLKMGTYLDELVVDAIPGAKFNIVGKVKAGTKFEIKTVSPQACEYQVHDGMISYPIALFIETVLNDPKLYKIYGKKAEGYLSLIDKNILQKWESTWIDIDHETGVYRFTNNLTQRFPGYSLPHNQYLALGRSLLVLSDISDFYNSTLCRKRATALAKNFKKNLHAINDIYIWNYWDPLPGEKYNRYVEDSIHAGIAVGFVNEAVKRKIIFNRNDLIHLSNTYVKVIWNQNILNPEFSELINGKRVAKRIPWQNWLELADVNPLILEIALSLNEKYLRIGYFRMIPPLLQICLRLNCKKF